MRPPEFSEQDIIEAGKSIEEKGKRVTGYAIRQILGGGDQSRLFSVWQSHSNQSVVEHIPEQNLPVELDESLGELGDALQKQLRSVATELYRNAVKVAERQVMEITRQYKDLEEQTAAELQDAASIIDALEERLRTLEREHQSAIEAKDQANREAEQARTQAFQAETKMQEMGKVDVLLSRIEALENRLSEPKSTSN